jgi:ABC-type phosphate/phosphonate transport system permease subunit
VSASLGSTAPLAAPLRDPAARGRLGALVAAIVVLWPLLVLAEFRPAALFESGHLQVMADFLRGFLPPSTAPDFLPLLAKATLETLAIATAGIALAFLSRRRWRCWPAAPWRSRASARGRAGAAAPPCAPARARC